MKYQSTYNRLRRIEGQIRGIEDMVAKDRSPQEILIQLEAVKSSVGSTISNLIENLLTYSDEKIILKKEELVTLLRLIKKN